MKKINRNFVSVGFAFFLLFFIRCSTSKQENKSFKIIAYLTPHGISAEEIPYQYLTHINYSFVVPEKSSDGKLTQVPNPEFLKAVVANAHKNNVKVFISVGGWGIGDGGGNDTRFEVLANNAASRTTFTQSVMEIIREFNLDGADIDWEYPDPIQPSSDNYVLLMKELRDTLHKENKKLSAAVVSYHDRIGYGIKNEIFGIVDWLNLMAYDDDYNTFGGAHVPHAPYWLAVRSFDYWVKDRGLKKEKAIMGVPLYGKGNKKADSYKQLLKNGADPCSDVHDSIYYNGIKTIKEKTNLAKKQGGGIMMWELKQDSLGDLSLLKAIYDEAYSQNEIQ